LDIFLNSNIVEQLDMLKSRGRIDYLKNSPIAPYTSFKIGGPCDLIIKPADSVSLCECVDICKNNGIKYIVLGKGSNVLFSDEGYRGAVILTSYLNSIEIKENKVYASAGTSLTYLASKVYEYSLSGLEFAYGIPGSVGGAVFMNAGAYEGEMSQIVCSSTYYEYGAGVGSIDLKGHDFGYRHSSYMDNSRIILGVEFELSFGDKNEIRQLMETNMQKRISKQPLDLPSAGSVFKRYPGYYTAQLIDECGLKGVSVNGAMVSPKHAGFIVNTKDATASDVLELISIIKKKIYDKYGINIETEVRYIQ